MGGTAFAAGPKHNLEAGSASIESMDTRDGMKEEPATTAQRAAAILRQRILDGTLAPASPLRESALIAELEISRNTLREAFQQLSIEGLTEQRLYRGTVVRRIGALEVKDIFIARRVIELKALAQPAGAESPPFAAMRAACEREEAAARRQDWSKVGTASLQFHQAIVRLLGSRKLDAFFEVLAAQLRLAFSEIRNEASFQAPWPRRDREICELVEAGRTEEAVAAMDAYLNHSEKLLLDVLHATQGAVAHPAQAPREPADATA